MARRSSASDHGQRAMKVRLKVNFDGDRLIFHGPTSGVRYEYILAKDVGVTQVEEADVEGLKKITRREGCKCNNKDGSGGDVQYITYHLFEDLLD